MVLDRLDNHARYHHLHPRLAEAFAFLAGTDLAALHPGRQGVQGELIYAMIAEDPGRGRSGARLEAHRRYLDIQVTLSGAEEIGWRAVADCDDETHDYDPARDVGFFGDAPSSWISVPAGHFAIFFPEDAHAPLGGEGTLRKVVVKVAIE